MDGSIGYDGITSIGDVLSGKLNGKKVRVRGWAYRARSSNNLAFIVIRDASGIIQCAFKKDSIPEETFEKAKGIYVESSLWAEGTVREDSRAPGGYELSCGSIGVICQGTAFPIAKDQSIEFLLDTRHLWLRSQKLTNVMKARYRMVNLLREFFDKDGFYEVAPPIITKAGCEGGSTLFELDYFGDKAYLTQSSQLYAEIYITSLEKVYVFAPSFRAEPSRTVRHLAEYWHLEPEMAFYDNKMNMELQEKMIQYVANGLAEKYPGIVKACGQDPAYLASIKAPFERIPYDKAIEIVNSNGGKMEWGEDFGADEEALLTKGKSMPVFVHNFPKKIKSFYMRPDPAKPDTVLCADMIAPFGHGEIIGGSERIWEYDYLLQRIKEENLDIKNYEWYLDLRKYGSVPHSGFGLGIERLVKWMLNLDHIRDAIPFPRTINRVYP